MLRSFRWTMAFLIAAALAPATPAHAADDPAPATIGLGFRSTQAPIGARWWITSMFGVDAGFGFFSEDATAFNFLSGEDVQATLMGWTIDVGAPVCLKQWQRVHCIVRPGLLYHSGDDVEYFIENGLSGELTSWNASLDFEVEVFLVANFSVSASYGVGYTLETAKSDFDGDGVFDTEEDLTNAFNTRGSNLTEVGLHVYLW